MLSNVEPSSHTTATRLRKHLPTVCQLLQFLERDLEQLSTCMDHTLKTHCNMYRMPDSVYQTAKVSKLLLIVDGKADQFVGKQIDDINIDLNPVCDNEENVFEELIETPCTFEETEPGIDMDIKRKNRESKSKVQIDNLEERFGNYRQLAGSQYHVSVQQIFESEAKSRIQAIMPLALTSHNFGEIIFNVNYVDGASLPSQEENAECDVVADILANNCMVDEDDIDEISDTMWPLLTYIGGYCSHQITKKLKCNYCVEFLKGSNSKNTRLIAASDRGGLSYLSEDVVRIVASVYVISQKLISFPIEHVFVKQINQRATMISLGMENRLDRVFIRHA
ncbi:hypothetical protein ILUMI_04917 [Ignelater luminosus]|uniref:Uncharacterized protein n=1 Tax=Ignelater luminosus TaxID=2038154 RepID=A0A8K0D8R1_IGNLU|nr:hypothetical protein ILUMI_04917 [Ignelater luminosus]